MDRWGENASLYAAIYFHSFILHLCCPLSGHPWKLNVISLQVMEITNVPGAQAGSIPLASLVGCYGALLLFCCSLCWHHISWPAFGTGSTFRHCLNWRRAFGTADRIPRALAPTGRRRCATEKGCQNSEILLHFSERELE